MSGRALQHPVALAALVLLVVNDHILKAASPGWLTGKLSDVAGLVFFPLLVAAAVELASRRDVAARAVAGVAIAVGVGFAAIKLWSPASDAYRVGLAALQWPAHALVAVLDSATLPAIGRVQLTADPTDLLALPALLVPVWLVRPPRSSAPRPEPAAAPDP